MDEDRALVTLNYKASIYSSVACLPKPTIHAGPTIISISVCIFTSTSFAFITECCFAAFCHHEIKYVVTVMMVVMMMMMMIK